MIESSTKTSEEVIEFLSKESENESKDVSREIEMNVSNENM